jgi:hypothetical protein
MFPESVDRWHMKLARLSALRTSRLYPPGDTLVLMSVGCWVYPRVHIDAGRTGIENYQWHHRKSNPRPSGLWRSASINREPFLLLRGFPVLLIPFVAVVAIPFGVLWFCIHLTWLYHLSRRDLVNFTVSYFLICPLSLFMYLFSNVDW